MMLELPGDARIQILVQPAGEATVVAPLAAAQPPVLEERGNGGKRLLQVGAVLGLLFLAFFAGQHTATPPHPGGVAPARAQGPSPLPAPPPADGLPSAFREQLRQPPTITPPPGAPTPGKNPFGLEE